MTANEGRQSALVYRLSAFIGVACGLSAAAIWGGMYVVSDVVLGVVPPFTLLTLRLLLGMVSLAGLAWVVSRRAGSKGPGVTAANLPALLSIGVVGYGLSLGLQFWGTRLSTAANGALITSASPAFIALFAYWLLHERLSRLRLGALALATLGVIIVVFDLQAVRLSAEVFWGNVALLGAAMTWGLYSVLVKRATTQGLPTLSITLLAPAGGLLVALPLAAWELTLGGEHIGHLTFGVIAGILFLGIICTALAVYLWNKSFERLDAAVASLLFFAQPLVGALLSTWLLGELLRVQFFIGGGLIGLGGLLVALERRR